MWPSVMWGLLPIYYIVVLSIGDEWDGGSLFEQLEGMFHLLLRNAERGGYPLAECWFHECFFVSIFFGTQR